MVLAQLPWSAGFAKDQAQTYGLLMLIRAHVCTLIQSNKTYSGSANIYKKMQIAQAHNDFGVYLLAAIDIGALWEQLWHYENIVPRR